MDYIYQVVAQFDDSESLSYMLIGNFTSSKVAKQHKQKWIDFFDQHKNILDQPQNWDPTKDEWYTYNDDWYQSKQYYELLAKYEQIKDFATVDIKKLPLNADVFITNFFWR